MTIIKTHGGLVKIAVIVVILSAVLFSFQNCGGSLPSTNFINQAEEILSESGACPNGVCYSESEYLWLQIREYNPYKIQISTLNQGYFNVGGICGTGNFANHSFLWVMKESFGTQDVVGQGFEDNLCESGKFILPIVPNRKPVIPDSMYFLEVELVGVNGDLQQVSNPMPSNIGVLDIVFTTDAP